MAHRNKIQLSYLAWAWIGVAAIVVGGVAATILMPERAPANTAVALQLPAEPDRYAAASPATAASYSLTGMTSAARQAVYSPDQGPDEAEAFGALGPTSTPAPTSITSARGPQEADPVTTVAQAMAAAGGDAVLISVDAPTAETAAGDRKPQRPRTASEQGEQPKAVATDTVAILVSGLGLDSALTQQAIDTLPSGVSLSFAPYATDLEKTLQAARADGHDVVLELPMEQGTAPADALGSAALLLSRSAEANMKRLEWILARDAEVDLVTNYLGRTFSADREAMAQLLLALQQRGIAYVDDTGLARATATTTSVPYAAVAAVLSPTTKPADLTARLDAARTFGGAETPVIKIYASNTTLTALAAWLDAQGDSGLRLAPLSEVVAAPVAVAVAAQR